MLDAPLGAWRLGKRWGLKVCIIENLVNYVDKQYTDRCEWQGLMLWICPL